jgi:hypothetical protein
MEKHPENAHAPMEVTPSGTDKAGSDMQSAKASSPMHMSPGGRRASVNMTHP